MKQYRCEYCSMTYNNPESYQNHLTNFCPLSKPSRRTPFSSSTPQNPFDSNNPHNPSNPLTTPNPSKKTPFKPPNPIFETKFSRFSDPSYLQYLSLKERFEGKKKIEGEKEGGDYGLQAIKQEMERGQRLWEDIEEMEGRMGKERKEKGMEEVEKLVNRWKEQKEVLGVKDSDVEGRSQVLFGVLDTESNRRRQYINDMELFKKKLEDTKAVSTSNVVRRKEIEDIIIQRDSIF